MSIPVLAQTKIQARVLVPLIKALQAELGEKRANQLVRNSLGAVYRQLGEQWWSSRRSQPLADNITSAFAAFAKGDAIDYNVRVPSQDLCEIEVTGCRYAQFFREMGEPELGYLLVCAMDFPFAEGFGGDVELTRTKTLMQGAGCCDFLYRRRHD